MTVQVTGPATTGRADVNVLRASWDLSVASLVLQVTSVKTENFGILKNRNLFKIVIPIKQNSREGFTLISGLLFKIL